MARLCEEFTLCGLPVGGVRGVESAGLDRVIVTQEDRTVTVYKVSDQKPLGSWTVKQTQKISCPAVYNNRTREYVVVHDHKILRIWKDEDVNLEKTFKATLAADIYQIHTLPSREPLVLFERGSVRQLDALLSAPQQEIEGVLSEDEVIRWSDSLMEGGSPVVLFVTEKDGLFHLYAQKLNPSIWHKFKLDTGEENDCPLSFVVSSQRKGIVLMCLYSSGCIYQMPLSLHSNSAEKEQVLPRSLLLKLPRCEDSLSRVAILVLDETHVAVLGVPYSNQRPVKDCLSIWNTSFQTLQAWKEFPEGSCGQLWCDCGKLFVPHGKVLTVIPFTCEISSLAAVLGKLKQPDAAVKSISTVVNWNTMLHGAQSAEGPEPTPEHTLVEPGSKRNLRSRKSQVVSPQSQPLSLDEILTEIQTGTKEKIDEHLKLFLQNLQKSNAQLIIAQIATILVARCKTQVKFYPQKALVNLLTTQMLSYSLCPDLMAVALDEADYSMLQLCLQQFPDIPEALTCACLKLFLSVSDSDLEKITVDLGNVASYVELDQSSSKAEEKMEIVENGFSPLLLEEDNCDGKEADDCLQSDGKVTCPVSLKRAVLLNEILLSSYSETFLLPHLKDLSVPQVVLFLRYLEYLYTKQCETVRVELPGKRSPTVNQVLDWISLLLDAHFMVLVMATEARELITHLHKFIRSQVKFYSQLSKIEGSLQNLRQLKPQKSDGLYSIEVIKIF
ncbi:nucleolar protein 11-like isoform X1 [Scyliorhinus canicula]|uniref:nucleolar protein 11-like isoform X1 n=1 Tax=Scyliorhinus canicula TaxID=7830 RepID=UPI0018F47950|nr:nucleolar protein 11-like isoform X1 [Scyliorhinus canicula]